jgi:hypothetical protein
MDLEKLNVAELNAQETQETEGGIGILATIAAGLIISAGVEIIQDWDNFKAGLNGEPER